MTSVRNNPETKLEPAGSARSALDPLRIRQDFPILQQEIHTGRPLIYFDNAASTQRPRQVIDAIVQCYEHSYSNVHRGIHTLSERSTAAYEASRSAIARFVGAAQDREIIFTTGTTLSVNTVARAWGDAHVNAGDRILISIMDHHSNIVPWQQLAERRGAEVEFIDIHEDGQLNLEDYQCKLGGNTKVVAIPAVSNVLGTINPVGQITRLAHNAGAIVVVDAAQHVPHHTTHLPDWDADFVCFSGHKMLGPSGLGILYGKQAVLEEMPAFLGGGSMITTVTTSGYTVGHLPAKFEAGTPPIASAIGMLAALDYLQQFGMQAIHDHQVQLADRCMQQLAEIPGVRVLGPSIQHRAGIVSFAVDGVSPQDISIFIDRQGIAIRAGHHCAMPLHERLGLANSCRASFYLYNTADEVDQFVRSLREVIQRLK